MNKLNLLFTKDSLQYQVLERAVRAEQTFTPDEDAPAQFIYDHLQEILKTPYREISVISALNHFTLAPLGFKDHESAFPMVALNAQTNPEEEEMMLAVNKKFDVQFYYTFPKDYYQLIKSTGQTVRFNFSGEKMLNSIRARGRKELHIHLYQNQCEFVALENKKVKLYNNLDASSEVDFLYFIMFTLSRIDFTTRDTAFFVYGETISNETFISELKKFVKNLKIVYDNLPQRRFILND